MQGRFKTEVPSLALLVTTTSGAPCNHLLSRNIYEFSYSASILPASMLAISRASPAIIPNRLSAMRTQGLDPYLKIPAFLRLIAQNKSEFWVHEIFRHDLDALSGSHFLSRDIPRLS